jgi:hypothetical protein
MGGTRQGLGIPDRGRTRTGCTRCCAKADDEVAATMANSPFAVRRIPDLQHSVGNAAVCRMLQRERTGQTTGPPIQRYPVGVPPDADCETLLDWMNSSNPYVPNWAQTSCEYEPLVERFRVTGKAPNFVIRLRSPGVKALGCTVDVPEWEPSDPAMRRAWEAEMRHIRSHENEHVRIGRRERRIMQNALERLRIPVTAVDREDAMAQAEALIQAEWLRIEGEGQERQRAIDPHPGDLQCPDEEVDEETTEETETEAEAEASAAGPLDDAIGAIGEALGGALGGLASWFGNDEASPDESAEADGNETIAAKDDASSYDGGWFEDNFSSDADDKDEEGGWWG